jgi:DNA-3-methyladenine glycosylase II
LASGADVREEDIIAGLDAVAKRDKKIARALKAAGYPGPRLRERGYRTLLRTIVGQQVSVAAASSMWRKLEAHLGEEMPAEALLAGRIRRAARVRPVAAEAGLRALAVRAGGERRARPPQPPEDDEEAIEQLTRIKGIGRWSAEIYLLFAEGRTDIWPAGDLAVQAGLAKILGLEERPTEKATRELAEAWRPHRGSVAILTWHCYNNPAL